MFSSILIIRISRFLRSWVVLLVLALPILACGPSANGAQVATDEVAPPENFMIGGPPQWVGLTATPIPTRTQIPTTTPYSTVFPPSGYATYTPFPGSAYTCSYVWNGSYYAYICTYATNTPYPGGSFTTPSYVVIGPSSTPRPTFTPYPTATPCYSFGDFYFGEYVYSRYSNSELDLRMRISNMVTAPISQEGYNGFQTVQFDVEVQNRGTMEYFLFPQLQLFIAEMDGTWGPWPASVEAAELLGLDTTEEDHELLRIAPAQTVTKTFAGITTIGSVTALGWIMDPTISTYQVEYRLVGGNVAYWRSGSRAGGCIAGPIATQGVVPTLAAPLPTASPSPVR